MPEDPLPFQPPNGLIPGQAPGRTSGPGSPDRESGLAQPARGVANLHIRYTPNPDWSYTTYFNFQNPSVDYHAFGTMFGPSPGSYNISQVFQPIEHDIYNYGVGVDYAKDWWTVGFKYDGSLTASPFMTSVTPVTSTMTSWVRSMRNSMACVT